MIIASHLHGITGLALLNTGLGVMRVAMGESADPVCSRPSTCYIEGDGNEGGGFSRPLLLSIERLPLPIRSSDRQIQLVVERESRAIEVIRGELTDIQDLTSGSLSAGVNNALRGLEIEHLWLHGKVFLSLEDLPHATRAEINAFITDIRERKRRPEFQAYAAALGRFHEAISSLGTLRSRFVETQGPFPPEELRNLLESLWHTNERARALQQEMNSYRQAVINAWRDAERSNP